MKEKLDLIRDSGKETPVIKHLRKDLIALDEAALSLLSADELRNQEINNIRAVIFCCVDELVYGFTDEIDFDLNQIAKRINFLAENPTHAGNHERHRKTFAKHYLTIN